MGAINWNDRESRTVAGVESTMRAEGVKAYSGVWKHSNVGYGRLEVFLDPYAYFIKIVSS